MNLKIVFGIIAVVLLTASINSMSINFFYSETCPHCQNIKPVVMELVNKYPLKTWGIYEIHDELNRQAFIDSGFKSVPAFIIKTDDNRVIRIEGADEQKFICEVQEMTTKKCPTYRADMCIKGSWFK